MIEIKTEGMTCRSCAATVIRAVKSVDAEAEVSVDLEHQRVHIKSDEDRKELACAIEEVGYPILEIN